MVDLIIYLDQHECLDIPIAVYMQALAKLRLGFQTYHIFSDIHYLRFFNRFEAETQ